MLKSLGVGLGLETFAKFLRVSVSVSKKKSRFRFQKNLVSEKVTVSVWKIWSRKKSIGFSIGKTWYRKKVTVSENLVSEKKSRIGFGQNFGIVIQCSVL